MRKTRQFPSHVLSNRVELSKSEMDDKDKQITQIAYLIGDLGKLSIQG